MITILSTDSGPRIEFRPSKRSRTSENLSTTETNSGGAPPSQISGKRDLKLTLSKRC